MCVLSVSDDINSEKSVRFKKWWESEAGRSSLKASADLGRKNRKNRQELARQTRNKMGNRIMK